MNSATRNTSKFLTKIISKEKAFFLGLLTFILFSFKSNWFTDHISPGPSYILFIFLFFIILYTTFAVVRHAEALSCLLNEPYGVLLMTLSIIAIEIMLIGFTMLTGENAPTLARSTMYAIFMVTINGMTGLALLIGAWRYKEQTVNLQGSRVYLSLIILLGVLGLILPTYTTSTPEPTLSPLLSVFLIIMSLCLYIIFLNIQTVRHRRYFTELGTPPNNNIFVDCKKKDTDYSAKIHALFLILYLTMLGFLNHSIALPIEHIAISLHIPFQLGGLIVTILVLTPEASTAVKAALENHIQKSVNIVLGSACATVCLTIPSVLLIGLFSGKAVILGLNPVDTVMMFLTLLISMITFGSTRTNILQGAMHILLFFAYVFLLLDG